MVWEENLISYTKIFHFIQNDKLAYKLNFGQNKNNDLEIIQKNIHIIKILS